MFKRVFVLLLLVAATVSVSTPAHASTLGVSLTCYHSSNDPSGTYRFFDCYAYASGGSPNYTFQWYHNMYGSWSLVKQETTGGYSDVYQLQCFPPVGSTQATSGIAKVVVTDSAGAQVTKQTSVYCARYVQ